MRHAMRAALVSVFVFSATGAFGEERVVIRDVPPTQAGVVKIKEYYDGNGLLHMMEALKKPEGIDEGKDNAGPLVVQSRHRYFYNAGRKKVLEVWELPNGTLTMITITEYSTTGEVVAERSFNSSGQNHFTRLREKDGSVRVIGEERDPAKADK